MEPFLSLSVITDLDIEPLSSGSIVAFVCAAVLLFFSAFLSASETAFLSLASTGKGNASENESTSNKAIHYLLSRNTLQASIVVWNNFINMLIIVLCIYAFNQFLNISQLSFWGMLLIVVAIAFVLLLVGEIIPKTYAQKYPLKIAERSASILKFIDKSASPLSSLLVRSTQSVNIPIKKRNNELSVDELSKALELTSPELSEEKEMLEGIIGLYNKTAVEIMTSRLDVANISFSASFKEVIEYVVKVAYSRIPIYGESQDDVKGILYIKDLLPHLNQPDTFEWQKLIRPAFFVPETKKIDDLLEEFRINKIHLAVVVDEFGGTSGIVTMEDILEEIVGDISDEYDEDEDNKCILQDDGSYVCDARILLTDFFRTTDLDSKQFGKLTDEVDTLAGLILEIKEDFPEEGETIRYEQYTFKVLEMEDKRILRVQLTINEQEETEE